MVNYLPPVIQYQDLTTQHFRVCHFHPGTTLNGNLYGLSNPATSLLTTLSTDYAKSLIIRNYTGADIVVIDRNGCAIAIPYIETQENHRYAGSIIVEEIKTRPRVHGWTDPTYDKYKPLLKRKRNISRDEFYRESKSGEADPKLVDYIDFYSFPSFDTLMEKYGGAFYCHELDLVFTTPYVKTNVIHPSTRAAELAELFKDQDMIDGGLSFKLLINDPQHLYAKAFINVGGMVIEVPLQRKTVEAPGVIITRQRGGGADPAAPIVNQYSLDDEELPIRIFKSYSEAEAYGDPTKAVELGIRRTILKTAEKKAEADLEKVSYQQQDLKAKTEADMLKADAENRRLREELEWQRLRSELERERHAMEETLRVERERNKVEAERLEAEAKRRRAQAEEEFQKRKESADKADYTRRVFMEITKIIAAVVTTAGAAMVWYSKRAK